MLFPASTVAPSQADPESTRKTLPRKIRNDWPSHMTPSEIAEVVWRSRQNQLDAAVRKIFWDEALKNARMRAYWQRRMLRANLPKPSRFLRSARRHFRCWVGRSHICMSLVRKRLPPG